MSLFWWSEKECAVFSKLTIVFSKFRLVLSKLTSMRSKRLPCWTVMTWIWFKMSLTCRVSVITWFISWDLSLIIVSCPSSRTSWHCAVSLASFECIDTCVASLDCAVTVTLFVPTLILSYRIPWNIFWKTWNLSNWSVSRLAKWAPKLDFNSSPSCFRNDDSNCVFIFKHNYTKIIIFIVMSHF